MKSIRRFLLVFLGLCFLYGCVHENPNGPFDVSFHHDSDVVVPAEGGWYSFTVEAVKTKIYDWADVLGYVEYKVHIDNTIIKESFAIVEKMNDYIDEGDTFQVWFEIPENNSTSSREVIVKANVISYEDFLEKYESHVFGDDTLWGIVWQGKQLAP